MRTLLLAALAILATAAGCQIAGPGNEVAELDSLEKQIVALIGDAAAASASSCKAIAFGSKPCGGPWRYLVYSTEHTDEGRLVPLVDSYNVLQDEVNRDRGLISDCQFVGPPQIALENGYCKAVAADAKSRN